VEWEAVLQLVTFVRHQGCRYPINSEFNLVNGIMDIDRFNINGYAIVEDVFSAEEVLALTNAIEAASSSGPSFRRTGELFAIRQFLKELLQLYDAIFNSTLKTLIGEYFGADYSVVKSIYFDKPETSNWFVAWHQDLTISVDKKLDLPGFSHWTTKQNQFSVQPPIRFLENIVTIRIHLDDTDERNGALRVLLGSHRAGIRRYGLDHTLTEQSCFVKSGGVMFMRPLLQHASNRTINGSRRRVIHIELSNMELPDGIDWSERIGI
jgi:ectoine hydroxylase-related dioxygenase (phytanoyl-CoA dioxygenase family)